MALDTDKIDEAVLALLYLIRFPGEGVGWDSRRSVLPID
jgi:hypothetical protein